MDRSGPTEQGHGLLLSGTMRPPSQGDPREEDDSERCDSDLGPLAHLRMILKSGRDVLPARADPFLQLLTGTRCEERAGEPDTDHHCHRHPETLEP